MFTIVKRFKVSVLLMVLILVLTTAVSVQAEPAEHHDGVYHTVQYGEYLSVIAQHYGVTVHAILSANPHIKNPNLIYYGTVLFIPTGRQQPPPPPPVQRCRVKHYVRYGENLSGIANWYGVSPFRIAELNNIYNLNRIYAGQYLCIP